MKKIVVLILTVILFASVVSAAREVRLTTLPWIPYADPDLASKGFASQIIRTAFQREGIETDITFQTWTRTLETVARGEYDALFSAYHTDLRARTYIFSDPYAESLLMFFARKGADIQYQNLSDLKMYTVGVTKGFANTPEFDSADYIDKVEAENELASMKNLIRGRVDLVLMDKYVGMSLLNRHFPDNDTIVPLEEPLQKKPLYLLFSKKKDRSEKLVRLFNKGLRQIKEDGIYERILQRHQFMPEKIINLGTLEWPPYTCRKIQNNGIAGNMVMQAYQRAGYEVNISFRPWVRVLKETELAKFDLAFPAYYSDRRDSLFVLKKLDRLKSRLGFMKLSSAVKIDSYDSFEDLKSFRIGVVHGYVNSPEFDDTDYLRKIVAYSDRQNIHDLAADRLDLVVIDENVADYLMKRFYPDLSYEFLTPYLDEKSLYLAFSKGTPALQKKIRAFEEGLRELKKDGTFEKILSHKYY